MPASCGATLFISPFIDPASVTYIAEMLSSVLGQTVRIKSLPRITLYKPTGTLAEANKQAVSTLSSPGQP